MDPFKLQEIPVLTYTGEDEHVPGDGRILIETTKREPSPHIRVYLGSGDTDRRDLPRIFIERSSTGWLLALAQDDGGDESLILLLTPDEWRVEDEQGELLLKIDLDSSPA